MLIHVHCYQENEKWYMSLRYEFEDEDGLHRVIIPKLDFPSNLTKDPKNGLNINVDELLISHPARIIDQLTNTEIVSELLEIISRKGGRR